MGKKVFFLSKDERKPEIITSMYCILWGLWILLPWDSFSTSRVFFLMGSLAPEWVWGLIMFLSGVAQFTLIFFDKIRLSIIASLVSSFTFISLTILTAFSNYQATAIVTYFVFSYCALSSYVGLLKVLKGKE